MAAIHQRQRSGQGAQAACLSGVLAGQRPESGTVEDIRQPDRRPRIWQNLSGGIKGGLRYFPSEHDSPGDGMPGLGNDDDVRTNCRWQHLSVILLFIAAVLLSCTRHSDPSRVFEEAQLTLVHGQVALAQEQASGGFKQFSTSAEWSWRFRLLEAEALIVQGRSEDVLSLLKSA